MFFWFLGTAIVAVWFVFRDSAFDYRPLCLGALLPDLIDPWFGGARVFHSVTASIAALVVIVVASSGRKRWRKRALAVPIGMMLHLVFDGAFANNRLFWWPFTGWSFHEAPLPSVARGWISVVLEAFGLAIMVWIWRTAGLGEADRRQQFVRGGTLQLARAASQRG